MKIVILALASLLCLTFFEDCDAEMIAFDPPSYSPVTFAPQSFVAGDFNGDGKLDIVSISGSELASKRQLSVLLGNGDGTFQTYQSFSTPNNGDPTAMVAGDFNNDGKLDVAITATAFNGLSYQSAIWVMLGNGDGTFGDAVVQRFTPQQEFRGIAAADFNGDGVLDLAVTDYQDGVLYVLLGHAHGISFEVVETVSGMFEPVGIAIGDFNGDGRPDIAYTGSQRSVQILTGNGDGTFAIANYLDLTGKPYSIAVADLNGDGIQDILVGGEGGSLSVSLGAGNAQFRLPVYYSGLPELVSLVAADFDGDGHQDVALVGAASNVAAVYPGNGDGTLGAPQYPAISTHSSPTQPSAILAGDFNGDGKIDFAVNVSNLASGAGGHGYVAMFLNSAN